MDEFDVNSLPPGLYVSASDSPAYALLRGMALTDMARLEGERYIDGGRKAVTVRVGGKGGVRRNAAGTISIGREFFVNAVKDYNDWQEKWWRECVQNSVDAGASNVTMLSTQSSDGTWIVSCADDGSGMDEDTLINKFLVLGGTTKVHGTTAGGFGKAKELLVLPWLWWKIESQGMSVSGSGIDYETVKVAHRKGTKITVGMPADQYTSPYHAVAFLEKCNLSGVKFTINGDPAEAKQKPGKIIEEGPTAKIYHNKSATIHGIFVRTHGLYMFQDWLSHDIRGAVFVEITAPSIQVLTANRDGFRDRELSKRIDALQHELAVDPKSAMSKRKSTLVRERFRGAGAMNADRAASEVLAAMPPVPPVDAKKPVPLSGDVIGVISDVIEDILGGWGETGEETKWGEGTSSVGKELAASMLSGTRLRGEQHLENITKQLVWQPDFYVINEIEGYRIPKKYYPDTMAPMVLKLAKTWAELCRYVLIQLNYSRSYGVGFAFSESATAMHAREEGEDWLLLNPFAQIDEYGHFDLSTSKRHLSHASDLDLKGMYALAIHEATHMVDGIGIHNEVFASAFSKNVALCADGFRNAKKIAGAIGSGGSKKGAYRPRTSPKPAPKPKMSPNELAAWEYIAYAAAAYVSTMRGEPADFKTVATEASPAEWVSVGRDRFSVYDISSQINNRGRYDFNSGYVGFSIRIEMGGGENEVFLVFRSDDPELNDWWDESGLDAKWFSCTYHRTAYSIILGR
jgi:hypothetical protein